MKFNKKVIAVAVSTLAAGLAPVAQADIELGPGISVGGFLDMSYTYVDLDGVSPTAKTMGIDQFETDFKYSGSDGISAQVDIEYGESGKGGNEDDTFVEQAFVTKSFTDAFSMKVGRFLSYSGWETEEPTGLFQYSGAGYAPFFYGYYQQGVSAYYGGSKFALMGSVVNSAFDPIDRDTTELGTEVGLALMPVEGLTAKVFLINDNDDDIVNFWTSYAANGFTFAFEYNTADYANGNDGDGWLAMGNYASGNFGFTVRYVDFEIETAAGATFLENSSWTFSPSYKFGSNLLVVAEYRMDDFGAADQDMLALEALFTF
jgi:hypothetical protein